MRFIDKKQPKKGKCLLDQNVLILEKGRGCMRIERNFCLLNLPTNTERAA